ncbi:MAG: hypothetical protein A2901_08490 [Elusimicrobia bacterium RIFCSPLOWO2_01_FULL_54_10]|nr:MAG: hypothetical protein A2901_08490 [Elusimicrobia bacterium RIFCSPLOWO2_01_FULL_54_10]
MPFKRMMFVCTNVREGGEAACGNAERGEACGFKLVEKLREEVKKRGLKGKIRVAKSGCMDLCALGPNIMVFDESGSYTIFNRVAAEDVPGLAERFVAPLETIS